MGLYRLILNFTRNNVIFCSYHQEEKITYQDRLWGGDMTSQQHSTFKMSRFFLFKEIDRSCCTFPLGAIFNQSKHKLIVFNINHSFLSSLGNIWKRIIPKKGILYWWERKENNYNFETKLEWTEAEMEFVSTDDVSSGVWGELAAFGVAKGQQNLINQSSCVKCAGNLC